MSYEFRTEDWNPLVVKAAKAMYQRLRLGNPKLPKWSKLGIDALDHYCIAAQLCLEEFHYEGMRCITVTRTYGAPEEEDPC